MAAEAALRSLLLEARQELIAACRALSGELHRVHKLEELRIRESCRGRDAEHCMWGWQACLQGGQPCLKSSAPQIGQRPTAPNAHLACFGLQAMWLRCGA